MKKEWLTYDLQFFADGESGDEGGEEAEGAEQPEVDEESEEDEEAEESEEEDPEEDDRDSIYAAARRRAESEARSRYQKEQSERDAFFANLCRGKVNPETNRPITNEAEYMEALQAQQRTNVKAELQEKGVDPAVIDQMISNNPTILQAQRVIAESQEREAYAKVQEDIKTILSLDRTYSDEEELTNSEEFHRALDYCRSTPGVRISDAYKIVNFDSLRSATTKAAKQAAINEAKGKGHLTDPNTPAGKGGVEIPEAELKNWKRFYPDKSRKELNALYAKVHSKR